MSQDKDFDIDSLINAEPPHTSSISDLGLVEDAVTVEKTEPAKEVKPKEKKSLFGSKKESKPKELSATPPDAKKKRMVMMITLIGMIGIVGSVGYQQVKQKMAPPTSPFPTMPTVAKPAPQPSLAQPNPNAGLPEGVKKVEMAPPVPTPNQMAGNPSPTTPVPAPVANPTEPSKDIAHADTSGSALPKVDGKPQSGGDAVLEEQKNALAKILSANASMAEGKAPETAKQEMKKETPVEVKKEVIVKEEPKHMPSAEQEGLRHELRQVNNSKVRELEIIELSARYLKANVNGKVLRYEVGDLLPGNAKILRIDINNEKVYTNKGNIVIR